MMTISMYVVLLENPLYNFSFFIGLNKTSTYIYFNGFYLSFKNVFIYLLFF